MTYQGRNKSHQGRYYTYADGNTVRKVDCDVVKEIKKNPVKHVSKKTVKNREKAAHMSVRMVLFYSAFMAVVATTLFFYIHLQSTNVAAAERISAMETQLNEMKLDNEEKYSRIMSDIDMDEIKRRAIEDLGMQYAQKGQIIEVQKASNDYVHQYQNIP